MLQLIMCSVECWGAAWVELVGFKPMAFDASSGGVNFLPMTVPLLGG